MGNMSAGGDVAPGALAGSGRDPRPDATPAGLKGGRCAVCGYPMLYRPPLCPACGASPVEAATFGPAGTVWSSTTAPAPSSTWTARGTDRCCRAPGSGCSAATTAATPS